MLNSASRSFPGVFLLLALGVLSSPDRIARAEQTKLRATRDAFIGAENKNRNGGASPTLRIKFDKQSRVLVEFDLAGIVLSDVTSARLVLTVSRADSGWGGGRPVEARLLRSAWTEGIGTETSRGSGSGVTWNCATDTDISDSGVDCVVQWGGGAFSSTVTDSVIHTSGMTGTVEWDVTADVQNARCRGYVDWSSRSCHFGPGRHLMPADP